MALKDIYDTITKSKRNSILAFVLGSTTALTGVYYPFKIMNELPIVQEYRKIESELRQYLSEEHNKVLMDKREEIRLTPGFNESYEIFNSSIKYVGLPLGLGGLIFAGLGGIGLARKKEESASETYVINN